MPSVLFVCTANQFRSPIAAAFFRRAIEHDRIPGNWVVESAGTWTQDGMQAPKLTLEIAESLGLEGIDSHETRQIDEELLDRFDLIVVMESGHKEAITSEFRSADGKVFLLSELASDFLYDVPDPVHPGISPEGVGRELSSLVDQGRNDIIRLAELHANSQS